MVGSVVWVIDRGSASRRVWAFGSFKEWTINGIK